MEKRNATAAVIGVGDFIGAEIARKFAAEGFTVFAGRRNGEKLQPLVQRSFLVKDVAASSQDLSAVAAAGLAALDALEHGGKADEAWKTQQVAVLQQAQKPKGQYLLIPAAAIQKLVEAAAAGGSCAAAK